jgi:hypothetical protein
MNFATFGVAFLEILTLNQKIDSALRSTTQPIDTFILSSLIPSLGNQ